MSNIDLLEHLAEVGMNCIEQWQDEGIISEDQARLMYEEAEAILMEDPYGVEAFESPWERSPHVSRVYIVAAYHRSRRYGGAEEGGWWYDHLDPLTYSYMEHFKRSFVVAGPFRDKDDAYEVARDLNACESIGSTRNMPPSIVWRVMSHVPVSTRPAVYC